MSIEPTSFMSVAGKAWMTLNARPWRDVEVLAPSFLTMSASSTPSTCVLVCEKSLAPAFFVPLLSLAAPALALAVGALAVAFEALLDSATGTTPPLSVAAVVRALPIRVVRPRRP